MQSIAQMRALAQYFPSHKGASCAFCVMFYFKNIALINVFNSNSVNFNTVLKLININRLKPQFSCVIKTAYKQQNLLNICDKIFMICLFFFLNVTLSVSLQSRAVLNVDMIICFLVCISVRCSSLRHQASFSDYSSAVRFVLKNLIVIHASRLLINLLL